MAMEQQVREAIETFTIRVRRDMEAHLRMLTSDLLRFAQETQDACRVDLQRAVSDARADGDRSFRARLESMRGELTREMEFRLAAERAELQSARAEQKSTMRDG